METKHTPLPWTIDRGTGYIASKDDGYVPINTPFREGAHTDKHGGVTPEAFANAAYIVRACNAHEELVEAAKDVVTQFEKTHFVVGADLADSIRVLLKVALAKAEGKE